MSIVFKFSLYLLRSALNMCVFQKVRLLCCYLSSDKIFTSMDSPLLVKPEDVLVWLEMGGRRRTQTGKGRRERG